MWLGRIAGVAAAAILTAAGPASSGPTGPRLYEVGYSSPAALDRALEQQHQHAVIVRLIAALHTAVVRPVGSTGTFPSSMRREAGVAFVEPVAVRHAATAPALVPGVASTPDGGAYEWQYYATGMDRVPQAVVDAASRITIAVVDTGVDTTAPDLAEKISETYDVATGRRAVTDETGHGTFVASLAAGAGVGVTGFGGGARLLVVKVGQGPTVDDADLAAGIVYAVRHGARIVNVSIAGRRSSAVERRAVAYAARHGVLVIAAVGNDGAAGDPPEYPAALLQPPGSYGRGGPGLAVGASDMTGNRAPFSEHGSFLSLVAPGANVFGALSRQARSAAFARSLLTGAPAGVYGFASGTSFAAPQVAGAAALVWAADPSLSASAVARILEQTASAHGRWSADLGYGVLDAGAAVRAATAAAG